MTCKRIWYRLFRVSYMPLWPKLTVASDALKWKSNFLKSVDWQLVIPACCLPSLKNLWEASHNVFRKNKNKKVCSTQHSKWKLQSAEQQKKLIIECQTWVKVKIELPIIRLSSNLERLEQVLNAVRGERRPLSLVTSRRGFVICHLSLMSLTQVWYLKIIFINFGGIYWY